MLSLSAGAQAASKSFDSSPRRAARAPGRSSPRRNRFRYCDVRRGLPLDTFVELELVFHPLRQAHPKDEPFDRAEAEQWLPVGGTFGSMEHAILHISYYARFWTPGRAKPAWTACRWAEPFASLFTQGMVTPRNLSRRATGSWLSPDEVKRKDGDDWVHIEKRPCGDSRRRVEKMSKSRADNVDKYEPIPPNMAPTRCAGDVVSTARPSATSNGRKRRSRVRRGSSSACGGSVRSSPAG